MSSRPSSSHPIPPVPPKPVVEALRNRLSGRELLALETLFALRMTAQQMDNTLTEWMADTAASPARFQILMLLWAAKGSGVPHQDIVAALGVTRATVSGLMAALEADALVKSTVTPDDRRKLLATLTPRGETIIGKAVEGSAAKLRTAFAALSSQDLADLTALLRRLRDGVAATAQAAGGRPRKSAGA